MGYISLGILETDLPANWKSFIGQQFEILFQGRDNTPHKAAGIFTGIIQSKTYPGKKIVVLQPSADTTNANNIVAIGPGDRTAVFLDAVQTFRQSSYNMSNFPKWGGKVVKNTSDANEDTVMPPVPKVDVPITFASIMHWFSTPTGMVVGVGTVLLAGLFYIKMKKKGATAVKPTMGLKTV